MALDSQLLAVLACPEDKGPLFYVADEEILYNPRLARGYQVRDGIPVMLVEEASSLDADSVARLDAKIAAESITPTFTA
jgi:uncharacterized protein